MASVALIRRSFRTDGGAEKATVNYLNAYLNAGHEVTLICETWSGKLPNKLKVIEISLWGGRIVKLWLFWYKARTIVVKERFDWTQTHEWFDRSEVARLGDGLHSIWFQKLVDERCWLYRWITRLSLFHVSKCWMERRTLTSTRLKTIIVNSDFIATQVLKRYPSVEAKLVVHRNVSSLIISQEVVRATQEKPRTLKLLFVGSGWFRKGLSRLIDIMDSLRQHRPCSLSVYGSDKNVHKYVSQVHALGLDHLVAFNGVIEMTQQVYSQHQILILPSSYDPFPNVAAEALCAGINVLTTSDTGVTDFCESPRVHIADSNEAMVSYLVSYESHEDPFETERFRVEFSEENFMTALARDGLC